VFKKDPEFHKFRARIYRFYMKRYFVQVHYL